ncbi:hypothetical protein ABNX05_15045 [Lysinibacillus sp. M3]|uniref:Uncharacterized protein n=1 Tax=Lysinibacillus zambalensis TaxID=3160866 RepID=A0ABV1MTZ0_9BACI
MEPYTLAKGWRIAFGHFNSAEIEQMRYEGWKVESVVYLKQHLPKRKKTRQAPKLVVFNKNGIRVMQ